MHATTRQGWGSFTLGDMRLALPMAALREVLPLAPLNTLPCAAPAMRGGLNLRGVHVPVIDLRIALGQEAPAMQQACVVVMVHEGHILGLLADGVTGVFTTEGPPQPMRIAPGAAGPAMFIGSVRRPDEATLVSVLSPAALAALPGLPMVADPEPARQLLDDSPEEATDAAASPTLPTLLMRCGRVPLAIDALAVHATLAHPQIERSALTMGACRGVIDYAGRKVPALDLLAFAGLGTMRPEDRTQAFFIQGQAGLVALLISEVVDVVGIDPAVLTPLPAFTLPRPELFAGALPADTLGDEVRARLPAHVSQFLRLSPPGLLGSAEITSLARSNTPGSRVGTALPAGMADAFDSASRRPAGAGNGPATLRQMITFALGGETAAPLEQVLEILPYARSTVIFEGRAGLLGMVMNRGRSIPVMCLSHLTGGAPPEVTPAASVLVVESGGELVGFAVPQLMSIEPARWEPAIPAMGASASPGTPGRRQLAQLDSGTQPRMVPVLDLQALAAGLLAQEGLPPEALEAQRAPEAPEAFASAPATPAGGQVPAAAEAAAALA